VRQERIQNPNFVERTVIESKIADGCHLILQFDGPRYTPDLLRKINNLCEEFGKDLEIRFYGHYGHKFDASHLRFLPNVAALAVDCLLEATNLSALNDLANLRRLSLGIYRLDDQHILKALQLQNLERLAISETAKANIDLAPLEACSKLDEFYLVGHTKNIDCLARVPMLRMLSLGHIPKKQSLDFVSRIHSLRRLVVTLGGRANISEIQHPLLEELEVLRVFGFNNIDSIEAFPSLRLLAIEDQIRLGNVRFTQANQNIQSFRIFNCKTLRDVEGIDCLTELKSIRIGMTALNVESLLKQRLAASLKVFAFYTGKTKENATIRKKLDALGYREYDEQNL
jgi:protein phosphatase 1 regulatory subunit 7